MRILILIICLSSVFTGCSSEMFSGFSSESVQKNNLQNRHKEEITIIFPPWPESDFPALSGYTVKIISAESSETFFQPAEIPEITKQVPVNEPLSVTARPITLQNSSGHQTIFFKSCGAVYPSSAGTQLELTFEEGFTAYIMEQYFLTAGRNGNSPEDTKEFAQKFNWQKITEHTEANSSGDFFYNPWNANIKKIVLQICSKTFTATCLNMADTIEADFDEVFTQKGRLSPEKIISAYPPETDFINRKKKLTLKKESINQFLDGEIIYNIYVEKNKKISLETEFMPIIVSGEL